VFLWLLWVVGCADPEVRLDCEAPEAGDLEGYCIFGSNEGAAAALADRARCAEEPSLPDEVARGPGGCEDPSQALLDAEQAAYVQCWQEAYEATMMEQTHSGDTGCEPTTSGGGL